MLLPHLGHVNEPAFRDTYNQVVEDVKAFLRCAPERTIS